MPSDPSLMDHLSGGNFAGFKAKMQEHASSAAAAASDLHATHVAPGVAAMRDLHEQHVAPHTANAGTGLGDALGGLHRNLADLHATHVAPAVAGASESAGAWHDENVGGPLAAAAASASAAVAGASLFGAAPDPEGGELRGSR